MIAYLKGCLLIVAIDRIVKEEDYLIINRLMVAGAQVYLVGGALRDYYLGYPINDLDLEVYHLSFEEIKELFNDYDYYVNDDFQTIKINNIEIALPRLEKKVGQNYLDYQLDFKPDLSLEIASSRRDFTINALMYCFNTGELYDFYDGLKDINNKVLRMIDPNKYVEDSIRVLRLLKYHAKYKLDIEKETLSFSKMMSISVWLQPKELVASYLQDIVSYEGLDIFKFFEILSAFLLVPSLKEKNSKSIHHPEKNLFKHVVGSLLCLNLLPIDNDRDRRILFVALLFHDYGKIISAKKHVEYSVHIFDKYKKYFLKREKEWLLVTRLIQDHMKIREFANKDEFSEMEKLMKSYGNQFYLLEYIGVCDYGGRVSDYNKLEYEKRILDFNDDVITKYRRLK